MNLQLIAQDEDGEVSLGAPNPNLSFMYSQNQKNQGLD